MAKSLGVKYSCTACGATFGSWTGRCTSCGEWNTLAEQVEISTATAGASGKKLPVESITKAAAKQTKRVSTKMAEVDTVLGGGLVAGSINLLAGQPGIGKSTLLLQLAHFVAADNKVLYVSGEESVRQVALRAKRLGTDNNNLQLAVSTSANDIASTLADSSYDVVIVDSIQCPLTRSARRPAASAKSLTQLNSYQRRLRLSIRP
jgi:DNA repair protein RadA/Sms